MAHFTEYISNLFPVRRLRPTQDSVNASEQLYLQIPQELVETWLEQNNLSNPQSTDPHVCVAWAARCDFVETIIRIRDRAAHPMKYAAPTFEAKKGFAA